MAVARWVGHGAVARKAVLPCSIPGGADAIFLSLPQTVIGKPIK